MEVDHSVEGVAVVVATRAPYWVPMVHSVRRGGVAPDSFPVRNRRRRPTQPVPSRVKAVPLERSFEPEVETSGVMPRTRSATGGGNHAPLRLRGVPARPRRGRRGRRLRDDRARAPLPELVRRFRRIADRLDDRDRERAASPMRSAEQGKRVDVPVEELSRACSLDFGPDVVAQVRPS